MWFNAKRIEPESYLILDSNPSSDTEFYLEKPPWTSISLRVNGDIIIHFTVLMWGLKWMKCKQMFICARSWCSIAESFQWNRYTNKNVSCLHFLGFMEKVNYTVRALLRYLEINQSHSLHILQRQILKSWLYDRCLSWSQITYTSLPSLLLDLVVCLSIQICFYYSKLPLEF